MRVLLVNPNTSRSTTDAMLAIAREAAPAGMVVDGATAASGSPLIVDEALLAAAADAVVGLVRSADLAQCRGIIVSAFGDPGLGRVRALVPCPVTGIAEAAMAEAAQGGRPFAVATTTPNLAAAVAGKARFYGHGRAFRGVHLTPGEPAALMADAAALEAALEQACLAAVAAGAEAVVIGGGPLALAARALRRRLAVPIVEPIPAAVRLAWHRASAPA